MATPVQINSLSAAASMAITDVLAAFTAGGTTKVTPDLLPFVQSGTGAIARTMQSKGRDVVNVKDFGASSASSEAANKTALQTAITAVDAAGGGVIVVDYDIDYGLKTRTPSTWPSFSGVTSPITIYDSSRGSTQDPAVYPTGYDGMQTRIWMFTPQTTSPGQHDGNTFWLRGAWAPGYSVSNDMDLTGARDALDNRRCGFSMMVLGTAAWEFKQGTLAGAALTDEELSNLAIQKFDLGVGVDTLGAYSPYAVERKTGNVSYSGGRSVPNAHHHFEPTAADRGTTPAQNIVMFESRSTTAAATLRNSVGSSDDVEIKNVAGDLRLNIPALGDALIVEKDNRYIGIGTDASYPLHLSHSLASDYVAKFHNSNATNGFGPVIWSTSAAGIGFSLLEAYSDNGADIKFRLRGDGNAFADGTWATGGADYAEYFEWEDGNPASEDRRGCTVTLVGKKIKIAAPSDAVIGVVSTSPAVAGDSAELKWSGKYLRDEFGGYVMEGYQVVEWQEKRLVRPAANEGATNQYEVIDHSYASDSVPDSVNVPAEAKITTHQRRKLNPEFNNNIEYQPRSKRREWGCVGLLGKLRVRRGQTVGERWIKMRDISERVEEWLIR